MLPSGGLRVRVYGGVEPLTKKQIYLRETIPPGPKAQATAERTLTRLQNQVAEKRHPRTSATLNQLLDRWVASVDVAPHTKRSYHATSGSTSVLCSAR